MSHQQQFPSTKPPPPKSNDSAIDKEVDRLRALQSYYVLDQRKSDPRLVRLCTLAARAWNVAVARFVVIDLDRCWTVASSLDDQTGGDGAPREMPRKGNIYQHILPWQQEQQEHEQQQADIVAMREITPSAMVVPDLDSYVGQYDGDDSGLIDTSYLSRKPGEEMVRFYAGAPVINQDGHVLGTLAVLDSEPLAGTASQDKLEILQGLALSMVDLMEEKRQRILSGADSDASFQPTLLRSSRFVIQQLQSIVQDDDFVSMMRHYQLEGLHSSLEAAKFLEASLLRQKERERRRNTDEEETAYPSAELNPCYGGRSTASGPAAPAPILQPPPWSLENDPSLNGFSTRVIGLKRKDSTDVF